MENEKLQSELDKFTNGTAKITPAGVTLIGPASEVIPTLTKRVLESEFITPEVKTISEEFIPMEVITNGTKAFYYANYIPTGDRKSNENADTTKATGDWSKKANPVYQEDYELTISDEQSGIVSITNQQVADFTLPNIGLNVIQNVSKSILQGHNRTLDTKNWKVLFNPINYTLVDTSALTDNKAVMKLYDTIMTKLDTPRDLPAQTIGSTTGLKLWRRQKRENAILLFNSEFNADMKYDTQAALFNYEKFADIKVSKKIALDFGSIDIVADYPEIVDYQMVIISPSTENRTIRALRHYTLNKWLATGSDYDNMLSYIKQNAYKYKDCVITILGKPPVVPPANFTKILPSEVKTKLHTAPINKNKK